MSEVRQVHLRGATGAVRTEMLDGREHIVVPVIALMDTVIHAVNATSPERVPLETLKKAAASWNGRPVVLGHPSRNGRQISASEPGVLDSHGLGTIFNSRVENGRLQMEAWHDVEKTARIAGQEYVDSIRAAKPHEVSVGAFVVTDGKAGVHANGRSYKSSWVDTTGDHLAMLPHGRGACSIEMGCGAHRSAMHLVTAEGIEPEALSNPEGVNQYSGSAHTASQTADAASKKANTTGTAHDHLMASRAHVAAVTSHRSAASKAGRKTDEGQQHLAKANEHFDTQDIHFDKYKKLHTPRTAEDQPMTDEKKTIRQRVMEILRGASDGPAEEAAELVQYKTIQALLTQCGDSYDEAMTIVKELIADESEPTLTTDEEAAEEEIESARLESINAHCLQMMGSLSGIMNVTRALLADDQDPAYPRYMEAADGVRALVGKRHSASDQEMVQTMHDHSVSLGADCPMNRELEDKTEVDTDGKELKAAASHNCQCGKDAAHTGDIDMTKVDRIKALIATGSYNEADTKWLEAVPDDRLTTLEAQVAEAATIKAAADKAAADLKAAQDASTKAQADNTALEARLKAAEANMIPADELGRLRALAAAKQAVDTARHTELVAALKTAQTAYTEEELKAQPLESLERFAIMTKVPDLSGRIVPQARLAAAETFEAPDPYAAGIKVLQAQVN